MKKRNLYTSVASVMVLAGGLVAQSPAALAQSGVIENIVISGAQRVEPETVRSYLVVQEGDSFSSRAVNRSLKKLFATGLFSDVTFKQEGPNLIVNVIENPVINRIAFEGNRKLDDETLDAEVSLRPRVIYTRTRVQQDVDRILTLYRQAGRFAATVEPKVIQLDQNRIDLVFEVKEGDDTGIESIRFVGNKQYDDGDLREVVRTRQSRWYNFLTADDNYDPDRMSFDKELLRRYYTARGFADFKVTSAVAELSPSRENFFLTYTVDEGIRYEVSSVDVDVQIKGLTVEQIADVIGAETEEWYDANDVDKDVEKIVDRVGNLGFPFVRVVPNIDKDPENGKIAITYEVQEGPRIFVERINIIGNSRTLDQVVRREFKIVEGDALNAAKLHRSKKNIENLNFFEKVEFEEVPGSAPDQKQINVTVAEKSTGSLSVGAGFSSLDGPLVEFGIQESNLMGKGQRLGFSAALSGGSNKINISFTEPYFLDRKLAAGFDVYKDTQDLQDYSSYDLSRLGAGVRIGYPFSDELSQSWNYFFDQTKVENVESDASNIIKAQEGTLYTSSVTHGLVYDVRDNKTDPKEGYSLSMSNQLAGLGGSVAFLKNTFKGTYYYPLSDDFNLNLRGQLGHILGLGEDVRVQHRFNLGGDTFRGFESSGIGPRDSSTKDALGGELFYITTAELTFPLGLPNEYQIKGKAFTDIGSVTGLAESGSNVQDTASLRASAGLGLTWVSPMGPIGIDYAVPYLKEDHDKVEYFRFSFGTRF